MWNWVFTHLLFCCVRSWHRTQIVAEITWIRCCPTTVRHSRQSVNRSSAIVHRPFIPAPITRPMNRKKLASRPTMSTTAVSMRWYFTITLHIGWQKKWPTFLYALTLPNIIRFSKLFYCQNQEKICNNTITKEPSTPQVCRYTTLWNVKCLN